MATAFDAFDRMAEKVLSLSSASRLFPPLRDNRPVSPGTLWRWAEKGCRACGGRRVKLRAWRIGGLRVTSEEAVREFLDALNADPKQEGQT